MQSQWLLQALHFPSRPRSLNPHTNLKPFRGHSAMTCRCTTSEPSKGPGEDKMLDSCQHRWAKVFMSPDCIRTAEPCFFRRCAFCGVLEVKAEDTGVFAQEL